MRYFLCFLIATCLLPPSHAQERKERYTEGQFQSAAARLYNAPLSSQGGEAAKVILTWCIESPKVEIAIGPPIMEMVRDKSSQADMALLAAYMAGQGQAQLRNKTKGGYEAAGGKKVIAVYRKITKAQSDYTNPAVEKLIEADKQRRLGEYLKPKGK